MGTTKRMVRLAGTLACLALSGPAWAAFHVAHIAEVKSGVDGNPNVQFVEIRMLGAGQGMIRDSRLTAFSCDGSTVQVLRVLLGPELPNPVSNARWIIATTPFAGAACMSPDRTWDPVANGGIPTDCGQVCWGAPGATPPDPVTWDPEDPDNYVDCVAYGAYTGPRPTGVTGGPTSNTPGGLQALTRSGDTGNDANDFMLAAPTPTNNDGDASDFSAMCTTTTTTSTTSTTLLGATTTTTASSTTTTTLGGPVGPPLTGGGSARTDCYGSWEIAGASKLVVRCRDNDPSCDGDPEPGCTLRARLCVADADAAVHRGRCAVAPVSSVALSRAPKDLVDRNNAAAVAAALAGLANAVPGLVVSAAGQTHTFTPALSDAVCTAPFDVVVPLVDRGGVARKGVRKYPTVTTAGGKRDVDPVKLICLP